MGGIILVMSYRILVVDTLVVVLLPIGRFWPKTWMALIQSMLVPLGRMHRTITVLPFNSARKSASTLLIALRSSGRTICLAGSTRMLLHYTRRPEIGGAVPRSTRMLPSLHEFFGSRQPQLH